ncbi:MAG: hypothetical protein IJI57_04650 [Flexilinea sp.]|nr:hypothetical protein [Flexilinea sp.]
MKNNKLVYPVIIRKTDDTEVPYYVRIPDFDRSTQGIDLSDAIIMAEDLLRCLAIDYEEEGLELPLSSDISHVEHEDGDIVNLIAVNLD